MGLKGNGERGMKKVKIFILITILIAVIYGCISIYSVKNQDDAVYVCRNDIMRVFESEGDYFNQIAYFYEKYEYFYALYDLSTESFVEIQPVSGEIRPLEKLCKEYSFNLIHRYDNCLYIAYNRPFNHSVCIGLIYDYNSKKWEYSYNHNYSMCRYGHLNGYRFYDLIFNNGR